MKDSGVRLEHVSFTVGDFALKDVCLEVPAGAYFVLTGPNGSGKTVLVRLVAGLDTPDAGEVYIAGRRATGLPPWERSVGYVPQDHVLFPHRNVERNVSFGLEVAGLDGTKIAEEVGEVAELLGIAHILKREVAGLSGGERQKVSLARALVLNPALLLLDEPVSAVDEEGRDAICAELKRIQRETGVTTIHVSHNRREAELVADVTGTMRDGVLEVEAPAAERGS